MQDKDFIVNVGPQSTFNRSGNYQTLPDDLDEMFEKFQLNSVKKIAVFFHGGLVNETSGLHSARNMAPYLKEAGYTPVCFVWETGLIETIGTNISKISQTRLFHKLLKLILKKVSDKIGFESEVGRGNGSAPITDTEIEHELSTPNPFAEFKRERSNPSDRGATNLTDLANRRVVLQSELQTEIRISIESDFEFRQSIEQTKLNLGGVEAGGRGFIDLTSFIIHTASIAYRIISRFIEKRDHDLYPTVVEEILREFYIAEVGAWVWKSMKDKSDEMWTSNGGRIGLNQYVGRYFLDKLAAYKQRNPETEISLIGHSAGAIAICNLIKHTSFLPFKFTYEHIILLAPACRTDVFENEILNRPNMFKSIRVFTMSDKFECKDLLVPYFYTHSLLYLISGVLEEEGDAYDAYILGMERHCNFCLPYNIPTLSNLHEYLFEEEKNRISFSVTLDSVPKGMHSTAQKHGDFDENLPTLRSLQFLLNPLEN
ncbi:MAG: hypothetical protein H7Y13_03750 [Sphingobacteriaceae bacterium]|nr:hypothetical protein [Sphingobacteriaceae bacterium]